MWPGKQVTIIDPAGEVLPGFEDAMREDLHRQLGELGVRLRLGTALTVPPGGRERPGRDLHRDHRRRRGDHRRHLVPRPRRGHQQRLPADGRLTARTARGHVPVTENLNVSGHDHVYAVGDITDLAETKRAGYAMKHAEVVAENIAAQLRGERRRRSTGRRPTP